MKFSKRFRSLRLEKGWSIEEAAKRLGVSKETIHTYERDTKPNFKYLARMASQLGVSLNYLVIGDEEQPKLVKDFEWFKKYYAATTSAEKRKINEYIESKTKKKKS